MPQCSVCGSNITGRYTEKIEGDYILYNVCNTCNEKFIRATSKETCYPDDPEEIRKIIGVKPIEPIPKSKPKLRPEVLEDRIKTVMLKVMLITMLIGLIGAVVCCCIPGGISNDYTTIYKCKSCHKEYKSGSSNAKRIIKSGFCNNCYNNYKSMQDLIDEMPVN